MIKKQKKIFLFLSTALLAAFLFFSFSSFFFGNALAQNSSCEYGTDVLGNCLPAPDDLLSSTPQGSGFTTNEQPSDLTIPGSPPVGQNKTFEQTYKEQSGFWYFIGMAVGYILQFVVGIVEWAVEFNMDVAQLAVVKAGWQVILNFTNLGFILAIIIIAFSTILHIQNYAIKSTLMKLIIAALLVNFSLVIAGSLLDVSHFITLLILEKINSGNLGAAFGTALQPQFLFSQQSSGGPSSLGLLGTALTGGLGAAFSDAISFLLQSSLSMIFVIIFTVVSILVLLTVFIMFMVRAANIIFLLMLSPMIWLCWVFPSTYKHWSKWWEKFIRWLVFAPASLFFIYLAIAAMTNSGVVGEVDGGFLASSNGDVNDSRVIQSTQNFVDRDANESTPMGSITKALGLSATAAHFAKLFVFIMIIIGGLFAANSFGIAGGSLGITWAEKMGRGVGRYAGRKGKYFGNRVVSKKWGEGDNAKTVSQRLTERAQKSGRIGKQVFGRIAKGAAGLERNFGEDVVKQSQAKLSKMTKQEKLATLEYADEPMRVAILESLAQSKDVSGTDVHKYITEKQKAEFIRHGRGHKFGDIEKAAMMNIEMMQKLKAEETEAFHTATQKFLKTLKPEDWTKAQGGDIFGQKPKFGLSNDEHDLHYRTLLYQGVQYSPGLISKILPKLGKEDLDKFEEMAKIQIQRAKDDHAGDERILNMIKKAEEALDKNIAKINLWGGDEEKKGEENKEEKKEEKKEGGKKI